MTIAPEFDVQEFVTCARYGDLDGLKELVQDHLAAQPTASLRSLYVSSLPTSAATALHQASANGHLDIITHILPELSVSDVNAPNQDGSTALHWAALNGKLECVEALLKAGADATQKNDLGRSPVTVAEQQGHMDVVNLLLKSFEPEEEAEDEETTRQVDAMQASVEAATAAAAGASNDVVEA
ncbi:hypothetical protein HKX48_001741 [Thoreauomyces humboldtii]|nr:hypothetical protein HKX48_001741 [Thoreauomyces humboldtii]